MTFPEYLLVEPESDLSVSGSSSSSRCASRLRQPHACDTCRAAKMRCVRTTDVVGPTSPGWKEVAPCARCARTSKPCIVTHRKLGRQAGSTNKFTKFNRALRLASDQIQLASHSQGPALPSVISDVLRSLVQDKTKASTSTARQESATFPSEEGPDGVVLHGVLLNRMERRRFDDSTSPGTPPIELPSQQTPFPRHLERKEESVMALSNPLSLMSEAASIAPHGQSAGLREELSLEDLEIPLSDQIRQAAGLDYVFSAASQVEVQSAIETETAYFRPRSVTRLDIDEDGFDPVNVGIVSMKEAEALFQYFYAEMQTHTKALDPELCTPPFVRAISPFLFTAICAAAAQLSPVGSRGMTTRLYKHYDYLANVIKTRGYQSSSIIQGFLIGTGWCAPASHISEEKAWSSYLFCYGMGVELGLHVPFSAAGSQSRASRVIYHAPVTPIKPPTDPWVEELSHWPSAGTPRLDISTRLQRHGERAWIHLYLWGSGLAFTLGRQWMSQHEDFLGDMLDNWHVHPFATVEDRYTIAILRLRRIVHVEILPSLDFALSRPPSTLHPDASSVYADVKSQIDGKFNSWAAEWPGPGADPNDDEGVYSGYLELLSGHHRLFVYSFVLKHKQKMGATQQELLPIVMDCLKAALAVVKHVVKDLERGSKLRSMINNIASMCFYSAICVFKCVSMFKPKDSSLPLYILGLLDRQASLMVTVGSTPSHRLGTIRLCGLHLRSLLVVHGSSLLPRQEPAVVQPALPPVLSEVDFWAPYGLSLEPTFEWMNFDNDGMFGMGDSFDIDLN